MRVSRTRFSKRRLKRKTEFPIVAVVQKKRKITYNYVPFGQVFDPSSKEPESPSKKGVNASLSKEAPEGLGVLASATKSVPRFKITRKTISPRFKMSGKKNDLSLRQKDRANPFTNPVSAGQNPALIKESYREKRTGDNSSKKSRATIDYKNVILLRNLITSEGKILARRINKLTAKQQRSVERAIKSARIMGLVPFINKSRPFSI